MMNGIWAGMLLFALIAALATGHGGELTAAIPAGAKDSVQLILSLTGTLCFWSGMAQIAEDSGFSLLVKRLLSPALRLIFPEIPSSSPAFNAICMNITANLLGLGNAATPLGIEGMRLLQQENPQQDKAATPAMIRFVVMNTASMQLLPTTAGALRQAAGSQTPYDILPAVWLCSFCSLFAGLVCTRLLEKRPAKRREKRVQSRRISLFCSVLPPLALTFTGFAEKALETLGKVCLPVCIGLVIGYGLFRKCRVYDSFLQGAQKGLQTAVKLLPSLCALVTATAMLNGSGGMELLCRLLSPAGKLLGIPRELLPLCLIRPVSGSGALSVYQDILTKYGPDSLLGRTAAVISGASETTFYAMTVYFGSVGVTQTGGTLPAALAADLVCYIAACRLIR